MIVARPPAVRDGRYGFSLIELLVGLVIGMIVLSGVVQMMIVQGRGYRKQREVLDVRETKELDGARLPNALHIPLSQLASRAGELSPLTQRPVVTYCARGTRMTSAARALAKLGFKEVYALRGGIAAWRAAGLPVAKAT